MNPHFCADTHLGHANVIKHDPRPFENIQHHDRVVLDSFRALPTGNELWVLGDVAFTKQAMEDFFAATSHLQVFLIRGNHDDALAWKQRAKFHAAYESHYVKRQLGEETIKLYLSHYSHRTWRNSCHGSYHLFGHSHGALESVGRSMDVGINCLNYAPISLLAVHERLATIEPESHHAKQRVSHRFVSRMEKELLANEERKGDWKAWEPNPGEALGELSDHVGKLKAAVAEGDKARVSEFTADVANLSMMIDAQSGLP